MHKQPPKRPTTMRKAFHGARITPSTGKRLVDSVVRALTTRMGYRVMIQKGRSYSDGPRPKGAPRNDWTRPGVLL